MARRPTARRQLQALAARLEPGLREAFLRAVADLTSEVEIALVVERLEQYDIEGALRALHIDGAAFLAFEQGLVSAYITAGRETVEALPRLTQPQGGRVVMRFDGRSPGAERFALQVAGSNVTGPGITGRILDDTRTGLRQFMSQGLLDGRNPRAVALDIAGRINRVTGRREGGIIGLASNQMDWVRDARLHLSSGDPALMRRYLQLGKRDKSLDRYVRRAIESGRPLPVDVTNRAISRLSDNYLLSRGEAIARTEMMTALSEAQREAYTQAIETGAVERQNIRKIWRASDGPNRRDNHWEMNGESVGFDEPFPNGLMYPHDPNGSAEEVINCRCSMDYRIDFLANIE